MTSQAQALVTFEAYTLATGKGVTVADKIAQHIRNGADTGALIAAKVNRTAIIGAIAADGMAKTAHALASGNIRPAVALIIAKAGKGDSVLTEDGKAPYSEWVRLGAVLRQRAQATTAGKPTAAARAVALHDQLTQAAADIRAARMAQQQAITSEATE